MKNTIHTIIMIFISLGAFAQLKTDAKSILKMQLFLNNRNVDFRGIDPKVLKNDSLYNVFTDLIDLKLDTLKITGKYEITTSVFAPKYHFYKINVKNKSNIIYKRELYNDEGQYIGLNSGFYNIYIIGINLVTGKSYRLLGFDTNDFLGFLSDFKELYKEKQGEKLTTKQFLKDYKVDELDFECLYNGLKSEEIDRKKYPCLGRVNDPIWIK
jgi:hypothetical protein